MVDAVSYALHHYQISAFALLHSAVASLICCEYKFLSKHFGYLRFILVLSHKTILQTITLTVFHSFHFYIL